MGIDGIALGVQHANPQGHVAIASVLALHAISGLAVDSVLVDYDCFDGSSTGWKILAIVEFLVLVARLKEAVFRVVKEDIFLLSPGFVGKDVLGNFNV